MNVTAKQFFSKGFVWCCLIPMLVFTLLHIYVGDWKNAAWQAVTLAILCANNYLLCSKANPEDALLEELQINIALIEYIRALLPPEATTEKSNNNPTQKGESFTK